MRQEQEREKAIDFGTEEGLGNQDGARTAKNYEGESRSLSLSARVCRVKIIYN